MNRFRHQFRKSPKHLKKVSREEGPVWGSTSLVSVSLDFEAHNFLISFTRKSH